MKTAARQILTFSIWIGMLAGSQLFAQQTNLDKRPARFTPSKTVYVAQQQEATNQSTINPTSPQPSRNTIPTPAAASQTQPSDAVPGTVFPGVLPAGQSPEDIAGDMVGVENGLWEGCEPGNCCAVCGGGYCAPPLWYTEQGARILSHSSPSRDGLSFRFGAVTGTTQLVWITLANTHSFNYNIAPGYDATIGRYLGRDAMDRDDFLEFTYWGMNTWSSSLDFAPGAGLVNHIFHTATNTVDPTKTVIIRDFDTGELSTKFIAGIPTDVVNPQINIGATGFDGAERHLFARDSEMHNWELNLRMRPRGRPDQLVLHPNGRWRRECQPGAFMSYLVGLRYMTVGEGFHFHSEGNIVPWTSPTFDPTTGDPQQVPLPARRVFGDYNILTQNDLLGFQIGADLMFRRCKWSWGVRSKIGPYVNFARNEKEIFNDPNGIATLATFNNRFSQQRQAIALVGEVGFEATYKFKPNLMGRAGYNFMWINGLALGSEQLTWSLDPGANDTISTNGNIYSHGISLGLEWCW